jgi:acetolactate synthase-1/2/3 large subunit
MENQKYAEIFVDWLVELGYTTCFFVAGGNSMHLLDSCRKKLICIPFVHEVSGGIASEYFNQVSQNDRSFVLITAGPGLTNIVTSISGAWLESRELLVVGGQVKSSDLATDDLRQLGIQEVMVVSIVKPITKVSVQITKPLTKSEIFGAINYSRQPRRGPCFIEMCLDVQAASVDRKQLEMVAPAEFEPLPYVTSEQLGSIVSLLKQSERPVVLIGGGISRERSKELEEKLDKWGVPILTTWNGADRYASDRPMWFGRPDTWGMRFANAIIQKSDLVIALGARLSLQQTGFNWQGFAPLAKIVHVDLDRNELDKGHPATSLKIFADADDFLSKVLDVFMSRPEWLSLCQMIKSDLPTNDPENSRFAGFIQPYDFVIQLSKLAGDEDAVIPCSSGGANTVMMQAFHNKTGQYFFNNKALASMGYGLAGSIGAALADQSRRTILVEGDGGFSQNLQELATVSVNNLNLKMFIFANNGYASIRMTQKNYFDGAYLGCDVESGLGFPDWEILAKAFGIRAMTLNEFFYKDEKFLDSWNDSAPCLYVVPIHPEQTYFPKISSQVTATGGMESAPLHKMTPPLSSEIITKLGLELDLYHDS